MLASDRKVHGLATEQHHTSRYHSSIVCVRAPTRACVCVYGVVCGRSEPGTKARAAASRVCARGSVRGAAAARSPGDKTRAHGLCALADCGRSCCGMLPAPVRSCRRGPACLPVRHSAARKAHGQGLRATLDAAKHHANTAFDTAHHDDDGKIQFCTARPRLHYRLLTLCPAAY